MRLPNHFYYLPTRQVRRWKSTTMESNGSKMPDAGKGIQKNKAKGDSGDESLSDDD